MTSRTFTAPCGTQQDFEQASIACSGPNNLGRYYLHYSTTQAGVLRELNGLVETIIASIPAGSGTIEVSPAGKEGTTRLYQITAGFLADTCSIDFRECQPPTIDVTSCEFDDWRIYLDVTFASRNVDRVITHVDYVLKIDGQVIDQQILPGGFQSVVTPNLIAFAGHTATIELTAYDSCGTSTAATPCTVPLPMDETCDPPGLTIGQCSATSDTLTVRFTPSTANGSNLAATITNDSGLPTRNFPVTSGVQSTTQFDVTSLAPGQSVTSTIRIDDDCDSQSISLQSVCTLPCEPPVVTIDDSFSIQNGQMIAPITASTPNHNATISLQTYITDANGQTVANVENDGNTASHDISGFAPGTYTLVVIAADDCSEVTDNDVFSFVVSDPCDGTCQTDPVEAVVSDADWASTIDIGGGQHESRIALSAIAGWPAGNLAYSVVSFDGNLGGAGLRIENGELVYTAVDAELCVQRNAVISSVPDPNGCNCSARSISLQMYAGTDCALADASITCVQNPTSQVMVDSGDESCDPCPTVFINITDEYYTQGYDLTTASGLVQEWWLAISDETEPPYDDVSGTQQLGGSGFADRWSRRWVLPSGSVQAIVRVREDGDDKLASADIVFFDADNHVIERMTGEFRDTIGSVIICDSFVQIPIESVIGSTVPSGTRTADVHFAVALPPPPAAAITTFETLVNSAGYLAQRQSMIDNADNYAAGSGDQSALQPPYYAQSIYCQSEVNAAEIFNDSTYIDRMFAVWDALKAAHNLVILVDNGDVQVVGANGFSNPQSIKGAEQPSYLAVENSPMLNQFEWANAMFEAAVRINQGTFATNQQKLDAREYVRWSSVNTVERFMTSRYWSDMTYFVERAAANTYTDGGPFAWDDKFMHVITFLTRMMHWFPQWGFAIPGFMSRTDSVTGRPMNDYLTWYRHLIGESLANGETTLRYGLDVVSGSIITANGTSWLPPNPGIPIQSQIDDVFHDARRLQCWRAIEETQQFLDAGTQARHNLHGAGFIEAPKHFIYNDGSCWNTYYRVNATERDPQPDGGRKPVWHWGSKALDDADVRDRLQHVIDGAQLGSGDACFLSGYDARNLTNVAGWVAYAHHNA